jgi:hypothetical protein
MITTRMIPVPLRPLLLLAVVVPVLTGGASAAVEVGVLGAVSGRPGESGLLGLAGVISGGVLAVGAGFGAALLLALAEWDCAACEAALAFA